MTASRWRARCTTCGHTDTSYMEAGAHVYADHHRTGHDGHRVVVERTSTP